MTLVPTRPYHHGNLPPAILAAAIDALTESGPTALSLRDVARRAGVTHTAIAHHFGDKTGLLTSVATKGFLLQAEELANAHQRAGSFLDVAVAYVRFATTHRAYFDVMYRADLYRNDDPALLAARALSSASLYNNVGQIGTAPSETTTAGIAAWSLVHGLATLWLNGALPAALGDDPEAITRTVAIHLGKS